MSKKLLGVGKNDLVGITSAVLCLIHCLATPILIAVSVSFSWLHGLCYLFLLIGIYVGHISTKRSPIWLRIIIWSSLFVMFMSIVFEDAFDQSIYLNYVSAAGLVIGHGINYLNTRKDEKR